MNNDELDGLIVKMCTESDYYIEKFVAQGEPAALRLLEVMTDRTKLPMKFDRDLSMSPVRALHRLAAAFPDVIFSRIEDETFKLNSEICIALRECGDARLEAIAKAALSSGRL
jgi:hypothetical protein